MNYHAARHVENGSVFIEDLWRHASAYRESRSGDHAIIVFDDVVEVNTRTPYEVDHIPAGLDFKRLAHHVHDTAAGDGLIVVQSKNKTAVIRPPFSQQRVYVSSVGGCVRFMRTLDDFVELHASGINWSILFRALANLTHYSSETAIVGVREILSGSLCVVDGETITFDERILDIARALPTIDDDFDKAAGNIRHLAADAILHKVRNAPQSIGIAVSGGLDSAALVGFTRETYPNLSLHLLNLYSSSTPVADERNKAIAVADKAGLPIDFLDIDPFTYTNDLGCHFERISFSPTKSFLTLGITHAMRQRFATAGISTLLSGDGGDQLFLRYRTPSLIKELVDEDRGRARYIRLMTDYAALNSESFWNTSWDYITGRTASRISKLFVAQPPSVRFINRAFFPMTGEAVVSGSTIPWRSESRKFQFFGLRDSEVNDCDIAGVPVQERKPFLYWPLIKYCMSLRRTLHTHDGRDRALERAAFKDFLPNVIYASEAKGGADDPKNRFDHPALASRLVDGELVRHGLLDKDQLRRVENRAIRTDEACVLARATTIESWLTTIRRRQQLSVVRTFGTTRGVD